MISTHVQTNIFHSYFRKLLITSSLFILFLSIQPAHVYGQTILWSADHETGDLSQYTAGNTYGGSYDNDCFRPPNGVVTDIVHTGTYAMKMTADISASKPACRQFRYEESSLDHDNQAHREQNPLYYSFWMYIPQQYEVDDWTNIVQFKTKTYDKSQNDAFWVLELRNRTSGDMYFALRYKGIYPGPTQGEGTGLKLYHHNIDSAALPVGEWVFIEIFLKQSTNPDGDESNYDGHIIVKQNNVELYNMDNIATRYPGSWNEWSINTYTKTNGILADGQFADLTLYIDDVSISSEPITNQIPTPTEPAYLDADINTDGIVDLRDYSLLVANFFNTNPEPDRADINADGIVDLRDYSLLVASFFQTS